MTTPFRVMAIGGGALGVALAHSWIVQAGDKPITLGADESKNIGVVLPVTPRPADGSEPTEQPGDPVPESVSESRTLGFEISTEDAFALWEQQLATFLDARSLEDFEAGHIADAYYLPYDELASGQIPEVVDFALSPDQPVVIYCSGGECDASHNAAALLQPMGFVTLHIYVDGYPGWVDAGHPIETGPDPFHGDD